MAKLLSIATSLPEHSAPQATTAHFMRNVAAAVLEVDHDNPMLAKLERFYQKSGIGRRYSVIPDYVKENPEDFEFYGRSWTLDPFPTTAERMALYERHSVPLAARAAREAMSKAGVGPGEVTHLIFTTCTGFFAPGPDVLLARHLELSPTVQRLQIGFMGCYAGFNGMRQAAAIVGANPEAVVLQVCLELCSLHYQREPDLNSIVANCLFADGCAAAIWAGEASGHQAQARLLGSCCAVDGDSLDEMSWHIGDHGFKMGLSADVPKTIERELPAFVDTLLGGEDLQQGEVSHWAIHPGGRAILEAAQSALGLSEEAIAIPRSVLHDYGNMSSATIFFVLERLLEVAKFGEQIVALGFGPGLTLEGACLQVEGAPGG